MLTGISSQPQLPSNKNFGWFFTLVFAIAASYGYFKLSGVWFPIMLTLSVLTATVTLTVPQFLTPLNRLWFELGVLLGKIVSPIVLGVIFFLLITPVSLLIRAFGRDALFLKKRKVQ